MSASMAIRAVVRGEVQGVGFRDATAARARELGAMGWVRNGDEGAVEVHAEGSERAVEQLLAFLREGPPMAQVAGVAMDRVAPEGHEQFAIRGISAGRFAVREHARGFTLELEVDGVLRAWAVPKGPSMDPAVKRFAVEAGAVRDAARDEESVWDQGTYEQGGRVPWPEALARGHAVFVLHGERLRGGFALQRTGRGAGGRWLLVKRRDDHARPGSDVVAEPYEGQM
jgi:DNA ligase D-like protein (predicted 3'-phosphoesterase)